MNAQIDVIRGSFLARQYREISELAAHSDVLEVLGHGSAPPDRYILRFHCRALVKTDAGVAETDQVDFGIRFAEDYQRRVDVAETFTVLAPARLYHPNVRFPYICVGKVRPGTGIRDLVYQLYEMITYHRVVMREDDALNAEACAWARGHQERFPLEKRPLCRRALSLRSRPAPAAAEGAEYVDRH